MQRKTPMKFVIQIKSVVLHTLLQAIAHRAYALGVEDGKRGVSDPTRVEIDASLLRSFL